VLWAAIASANSIRSDLTSPILPALPRNLSLRWMAGADAAVVYDRLRDGYMNEQGWRVLRVTNEDVFKRLDDVLDGIARSVQGSTQ